MTYPTAGHLANEKGDFEPQRASNWEFEIAGLTGEGSATIKLSMVSGALPNETNEPIELNYGNEKRYVAGKISYETFPLVCRDYVDQSTRDDIIEWRRQVYDPATGSIGLATDYKHDATITLYDPEGTLIRQCTLQGCWPSAVNHGAISYEENGAINIEVTIRYDKAVWGTGGFTVAGRTL